MKLALTIIWPSMILAVHSVWFFQPANSAELQDVPAVVQNASADRPADVELESESVGAAADQATAIRLAAWIGFGVFSLLAVLFLYLKIDLATRGFYTRRLQMLAVLAFVLIFAVVILMILQLLKSAS